MDLQKLSFLLGERNGNYIEFYDILSVGYAFSGTLKLKADCFYAEINIEISPVVLTEFASALQKIWENLDGTAEFDDHYSGLSFSVTMTSAGHAAIRGQFHPFCSGHDNTLSFEMDTDQSYLALFLTNVRQLLASTAPNESVHSESFFQTILRRLTQHPRR